MVLDDIRDMVWLVNQQDKLQGKYDAELEFNSTPGGQCCFSVDLFAVPVVATANFTTKNLGLLDTDAYKELGPSRGRDPFTPLDLTPLPP